MIRCKAFPGHGQMKPEQQSIERLRREVTKPKAERNILKKPRHANGTYLELMAVINPHFPDPEREFNDDVIDKVDCELQPPGTGHRLYSPRVALLSQ